MPIRHRPSPFRLKKLSVDTVPDGSEEDSGWDVPVGAIVYDCWIETDTAEVTGATKTLQVGLLSSETGGDTNGFLVGFSVAATGVVLPELKTNGEDQDWGALLLQANVETGGGETHDVHKQHYVASGQAQSLVWKANSSDWAEFVGSIYVLYLDTTRLN